MEERPKLSNKEIVKHMIDMSCEDPLYFTKLMLKAFGSNLFLIVGRLLIISLIVYPICTNIIGLSRSVTGILMVSAIIGYYSLLAIWRKIKDGASSSLEVKNGSNGQSS